VTKRDREEKVWRKAAYALVRLIAEELNVPLGEINPMYVKRAVDLAESVLETATGGEEE
jgi:hypothetical protein